MAERISHNFFKCRNQIDIENTNPTARSADDLRGSEVMVGEIGKLGNIRFIETSEAKIWKDETCPTGLAVFGTLVLGAHAYGVTELEGGGLEHIVKQLGYGDDPLNQRASVGWKGMRAAERLVEQYMVRIESVSSYSANAAAN